MRLPVELLPAAIDDARVAFSWYRAQNEAAAQGFIAEVELGLELIAESPQRWPGWSFETHRYLLRRYPYFLVYKIQDTAIWIVAVAHARRRPDFWKVR